MTKKSVCVFVLIFTKPLLSTRVLLEGAVSDVPVSGGVPGEGRALDQDATIEAVVNFVSSLWMVRRAIAGLLSTLTNSILQNFKNVWVTGFSRYDIFVMQSSNKGYLKILNYIIQVNFENT